MSTAPTDGHCKAAASQGTPMQDIQLEPLADNDGLIIHGLFHGGPVVVSLHSSARMKLLGRRVSEFDPLNPEVFPRIVSAAQRLVETGWSPPTELVITALDLD